MGHAGSSSNSHSPLLEYNYRNYAWGFVHDGFIIMPNGEIQAYSLPTQETADWAPAKRWEAAAAQSARGGTPRRLSKSQLARLKTLVAAVGAAGATASGGAAAWIETGRAYDAGDGTTTIFHGRRPLLIATDGNTTTTLDLPGVMEIQTMTKQVRHNLLQAAVAARASGV